MSFRYSILFLSDCSTRFYSRISVRLIISWLLNYVWIVLWDFIYNGTDVSLISLGYFNDTLTEGLKL